MGIAADASSGERRTLLAATSGRLDAVLAEALPGLSRARVQRLIASGAVVLRGEPARKSDSVEAGDEISVSFPAATETLPAAAPDFDLPVLYEDDAILVIDKPPALAVHGGPGDTAPSVAGWFAARHPGAAAAFGTERPGIVHRLDKDTSGVLLLAKTIAAQTALSAAFEQRRTTKLYLAVSEGIPARPRAVIDAPIGRHPADRTKMAIAKQGRASRSEYRVLGSGEGRALLEVDLKTGRTHQIRVHLAAIGVPVAGDTVYGHASEGQRQLLHAWRLSVPHPDGGTLTVTSPMPADIAAAVRSMGLDGLASEYSAAPPPERAEA